MRIAVSRVEKFLRARACPTVEILVVGPPYIPVSVNVEIALSSLEGASAVEQAVKATLEQFLHPLTGGLDGNGWDFGREPYKSDFYALLEAVPGVSYIRRLLVDDGRVSQEVEAIRKTGRLLVYSGTHTISLFFEES